MLRTGKEKQVRNKKKSKSTETGQPPAVLKAKNEVKPLDESLGKVLLGEGLISEEQLQKAQQIQKKSGDFLGNILAQLGILKKDALIMFLVKYCKIPHLSLLDYEISKDVLSLLPQTLCLKYRILPIDKLGRMITVAMVNPLDQETIDKIRKFLPEMRIKPILCNWDHWIAVSRKVFKEGAGYPQEELVMKAFEESLNGTTIKPAIIVDANELTFGRTHELVYLAGRKYSHVIDKIRQVKLIQGEINKVPFNNIAFGVAVEYENNGKASAVRKAEEQLQDAEKDFADWLESLKGEECEVIARFAQQLISGLKQ